QGDDARVTGLFTFHDLIHNLLDDPRIASHHEAGNPEIVNTYYICNPETGGSDLFNEIRNRRKAVSLASEELRNPHAVEAPFISLLYYIPREEIGIFVRFTVKLK